MSLVFSLQELEAMPTITVGQADNLKLELDYGLGHRNVRVWLSRCGVADGEPYENKVTVEFYDDNHGWVLLRTYQAQ